jgi:hypothetical protein
MASLIGIGEASLAGASRSGSSCGSVGGGPQFLIILQALTNLETGGIVAVVTISLARRSAARSREGFRRSSAR